MAAQMTFKRYELKYLLNQEQKAAILRAMQEHMERDKYGRVTIRNIYYDTEDFRLIRTSLDRPVYKEKLRLRSYQQVQGEDSIFVELKKKYRSVVYKRRLQLPEKDVMSALSSGRPLPVVSQIGREIEYFRHFYQTLRPAVFLSYEREAYFMKDGSDFRVTFDENILFREEDLSLQSEVYGTPILEEGKTLMELKISGSMPLWMSRVMTDYHVHKISFSKYGTAYRMMQEQEYQSDKERETKESGKILGGQRRYA